MVETQKNIREIHQIGKGTREYLVSPEQCFPMKCFGIQLAGISCATDQFQFVRHRADMRQVLVCFRGRGEVWMDGDWHSCTSGMAYVTPVGCFHAYRGCRKQIWEVGWCIYDATAQTSAHEYWQSEPTPALIESDPRQLESILQGLYHESSHHADIEAQEHWAALLDSQIRKILIPQGSNRLWRLWQSVQGDLAGAWTLEIMAKRVGMEMEQLRRVCHLETGRSPMRYVAHLRMQHAVSLLATNQKLEAVSEAVGYETPFSFSIAFKRIMGCSPSEFRKKLNG